MVRRMPTVAPTVEKPAPIPPSGPDEATRRAFLQKLACVGFGGCALLGPVVAGAVVVAHPLLEKRRQGVLARLALLEDLPVGGAPQLYQVMDEPTHSWLKFPRQAIGSVFLWQPEPGQVVAFNAACPHVSGPLSYRETEKDFHCPLHDSRFGLDGRRLSTESPSPRNLDSLEVEIRGQEVWVLFQQFVPNTSEKTPV